QAEIEVAGTSPVTTRERWRLVRYDRNHCRILPAGPYRQVEVRVAPQGRKPFFLRFRMQKFLDRRSPADGNIRSGTVEEPHKCLGSILAPTEFAHGPTASSRPIWRCGSVRRRAWYFIVAITAIAW